jgi:protein involved in polysaccharide export with SLBB domain
MTRWTIVTARYLISGLLMIMAGSQCGCVTYAHHAVPASRLPAIFLGPSRDELVPINLVHLRQEPVAEYLVGPGDTLGIYVQGVLPPQIDETPPIFATQASYTNNYYPPSGLVRTPNIGVPLQIGTNGTLHLPLVGPIALSGLNLSQAAEAIRKTYLDNKIVQSGRDRIVVSLIRTRVHRVLVIREDSASDMAQMMRKDGVVFAKRGRADVVDLPSYENDVLHAITATGGLPGLDCLNQVWILRTIQEPGQKIESAKESVDSGKDMAEVINEIRPVATAIRIPLRICRDEPLPFGPEDIVLHDGDILFIEPRIADVFYAGGLLPGGQIPLPRDHDVDVIEAIALAQGSIGGPGGVSGAAVFRAGAGPGNVIPPTRVLILRKLPNGEQLPIRVDLSRAMRDSKERIIIQPGDFVMLHYKPGEIAGNVALNFLNFNVLLDPKQFF